MSAQKELRELVRAVEQRGFTVEPTGSGHQKILYKGIAVNQGDPNDKSTWRPLTLPSTPGGSPKWRADAVAALIRASVLEEDPFRTGQEGLSEDEQEARAKAREKREQRQAEAEEEREAERAGADEINQVRERARAILEPIGVWRRTGDPGTSRGEPRRTIGEVARVAYSLAQKRDDLAQPPPVTQNAAEVAIKKFYDGGGGIKNVAWIEALLDELEAADDPIRHYFQLLRDELGIGEGDPVPAPGPSEAPVPAGPPVGPEPLAAEDEDDERVRDLRERLARRDKEIAFADEKRREAEKALEKANADAAEAETAAAALKADLEDALEAEKAALARTAASSADAKVPELAFEVLAEMIGQHVTVAPEEADNLEGVLAMLNEKKDRATALAKRVAALELGIPE